MAPGRQAGGPYRGAPAQFRARPERTPAVPPYRGAKVAPFPVTCEGTARLRWLGWFLFAGSLAAAAIESAARTAILLSVIRYPGLAWYEPQEWHLPIGYVLLGVALISVARVMRIGALRREEESRVTI